MAIHDREKFDQIFRNIISGLYYYFEQRILPRNRRFNVIRMTTKSGHAAGHSLFRQFGMKESIQLGGDVFRCKYQRLADDSAYTFWFLSFYRGVNYFVATPPRVPIPKILPRP